MPELPEVETIARTLAPSVTGRTLAAVTVLNQGTWQGSLPPQSVVGQRVAATGRRGKVLLLTFTGQGGAQDDDTARRKAGTESAKNGLAFHLKMTGRLFPYPVGTLPGAHTRVVFDFDDGSRLFFDDARKFGYVRAFNPDTLSEWPFWQKLGPEPLEIAPEDFAALFAGRGRAIKALLLDQTVIAGIGNIYADESLFRAGIRPDTPGKTIAHATLTALHGHLIAVLNASIAACGSSIRDYRTARGDAGSFQNTFLAYGRAGQPCTVCGTCMDKATVAGRTTVYCPCCQTGKG